MQQDKKDFQWHLVTPEVLVQASDIFQDPDRFWSIQVLEKWVLIFLQMEADISFFPKYIPSTVFNDQQSTASLYSRACSRACHAVIPCKKCVSTWEMQMIKLSILSSGGSCLFLCKPHRCSEGHQPKRMHLCPCVDPVWGSAVCPQLGLPLAGLVPQEGWYSHVEGAGLTYPHAHTGALICRTWWLLPLHFLSSDTHNCVI